MTNAWAKIRHGRPNVVQITQIIAGTMAKWPVSAINHCSPSKVLPFMEFVCKCWPQAVNVQRLLYKVKFLACYSDLILWLSFTEHSYFLVRPEKKNSMGREWNVFPSYSVIHSLSMERWHTSKDSNYIIGGYNSYLLSMLRG